jgi:hypothetical protein
MGGMAFSNWSQMIESTIEGSFPITPQVPRSIGKITSQACVVLIGTTFAQYHSGVVSLGIQCKASEQRAKHFWAMDKVMKWLGIGVKTFIKEPKALFCKSTKATLSPIV